MSVAVSGTGVKAPSSNTNRAPAAIGACMAELILDGQSSTVDISEFRPSRFAEGDLAQEHNVI